MASFLRWRAASAAVAAGSGDAEDVKQASSALLETVGGQAWLADGEARLAARGQLAMRAPEMERQQGPHPQALQRAAAQAASAH